LGNDTGTTEPKDVELGDTVDDVDDDGEVRKEDGGQTSDPGDTHSPKEVDWSGVEALIESKVALSNATIMMGNADGTFFSYSRGDSTEESPYTIASASKLLMAITTLRLVETGDLNLDTTAAGLLPFWTTDTEDPRSQVTLEQLLSFTSGFAGGSGLSPEDEALSCVEDKEASTTTCSQEIYDQAFEFSPPGSTFFYGPGHMYIAAAMALEVRTEFTWNKIFRNEIGDPLNLAPLAGFLLPSPLNGRPSGGVVMSAKDYATILTALLAGELLSEESVTQLSADRTPSASVILSNPPSAASEGEWHYALGCWRECPGNYNEENCDAPGVISSPGAFGFYPWWDQENGIWGLVALQYPAPTGASVTVPIGTEIRNMALELISTP